MSSSEDQKPPFRGFRSPNYTPVPDELFDELLVELSGAELKALLYIIRRTFGFKRDSDNISLSQMLQGIRTRDGRVLDRGVGLSKKTLLLALRTLEERGIILTERRQSAEKGNEPTAYRLNVISGDSAPSPLGEESTPPLGEKLHQGVGGESTPSPWGKNYTTQETVGQETVLQETEYSNSFELLTQKSKTVSTFEKSKKRDKIARNDSQGIAEPQAQRRSTGGMKKIGELLGRHAPPQPAANNSQQPRQPRRRGRPVKYPATPAIEALLTQWTNELHDDPEHAQSNVSQAARLWAESGVSEDTFRDLLYDARRRTTQAGNVEKRASGEEGKLGFRNRAPYFFACLKRIIREDLKRQVEDRAPATGKGKSSSKKVARTTNLASGTF
jgi:hypothetical protein